MGIGQLAASVKTLASLCCIILVCLLGESWLGLDKLHAMTTSNIFGLKVIMGDYDGTSYYAIYKTLQVGFDLNQR